MIISHRHNFIFVKTRKTAGTSVEIALSAFCGPADVITRIPEEDERLRAEFGGRAPQNIQVPLKNYTARDWARLLIRRNRAYPFAEHTSATRIRHYIGRSIYGRYFKFCIERNPWDKVLSYWHYRAKGKGISRRDYIMNDAFDRIDRLSDWRKYADGDRLLVDRVLCYENLQHELKELTATLGINWEADLPRAKGNYRKDRRPYWEVLQDDERQRIEHTFKREIEQFGYEYGQAAAARPG